MYVYDNHYIQGYFIYTYSSISPDGTINDQEALIDGCIPVEDGERNSTTSISLDITNYYSDILKKGGKLYVEFVDYAKNRSSYTIDLNGLAKDVTDIQIQDGHESYTLRINRQVNLTTFLDIYPQNTYVKDLIWTSSNEDVAIVKDGLVTGVSAGTAIITVANGTGEDAISCEFTITVTSSNPSIGNRPFFAAAQYQRGDTGTGRELRAQRRIAALQRPPIPDDIVLNWSTTSQLFQL